MNREILRNELNLIHYHWSRRQFRHEIHEGFPLLRQSQLKPAPRLIRFLGSHSIADQLKYAAALVRRRHPEALKLLGETFSAAEAQLVDSCATALMVPIADEWGSDLIPSAGKTHFKNVKREFRNQVLKEMTLSFGAPFKKRTADWWIFRTEVRGWVIETEIDTGGRRLVGYNHNLAVRPEVPLKRNFSLLSLLGIGGGATDWDCDAPDLDQAANSLVRFCDTYITGARKFLPNLSVQ